jgi:hypothetical protein
MHFLLKAAYTYQRHTPLRAGVNVSPEESRNWFVKAQQNGKPKSY